VKFIMFAAVGALIVTGATAAVMTKQGPETVKIEEMDEPTIKVLVDEINRKDNEIKILRKQLQLQITDRKELEEITKRLDEATREVQDLTDQIIELRAKQVPNGKPIVAKITSNKIIDAIETERSSLQFCLSDIDSRVNATEGAPKNRAIDAVIRIKISPNGRAIESSIKTSGLEYTPGVEKCVEGAILRVAYPTGGEVLDTRITIAWNAGVLKMAANVIGQDAPSDLNGI
jgi:TolA-binding protein